MTRGETRRTEILIETHEVSVIRFGPRHDEIGPLYEAERSSGRSEVTNKRILVIAVVTVTLMLLGIALLRTMQGE
jgi:hypothetical protein